MTGTPEETKNSEQTKSRKVSSSQAGNELPNPNQRNLVWRTIQYMLKVSLTLGLRYRIRGLHHLPPEGGGLLIINHQSFLDPLLIGMALKRPVSFMARDTLFRVPFVGWVLRNTYVFPVNRESAATSSIREAVRRMKHGFLVGIFPEGTRSDDGSVKEFKAGFISLVRRGNVPVYPIGIAGANEALPRDKKLPRFRPVRIVIGPPFTLEELEGLTKRGQEENFVQQVHTRVSECHQEAELWRTGQPVDSPHDSEEGTNL